MSRKASAASAVLTGIVKWIGAPVACAAVGYFLVAPRLVKSLPPKKAKPGVTASAPTEPSADAPEVTPTPVKQASPTQEDKPSAEAAKNSSEVAPDKVNPRRTPTDEKPVLEVTTENARTETPAPPKKKPRRHKSKPKAPEAQSTNPASADPASNGDPTAADKPASKGGDEPPVTPP